VLLFTPTGTFTSHPFLHEKLAYDQNELMPIARVTKTLISITVPTSVQIDSLAELVVLVRSQPGKHFSALQFDGLVGLFAAPGMSVALRERIAGDVRAVVVDPAIATRVAATGQIVSPGTPAEFAAEIDEQRARFAAIAKGLDVQPKR
jgi:tripartite-type tricarboxylate transporter receptor subunit TctC